MNLRSKDRDRKRSGSANLEWRVGRRIRKEWSPVKRFLREIFYRLRASGLLFEEDEFLDPKRVHFDQGESVGKDRLRSRKRREEFGERAGEWLWWCSIHRSRLGARPESYRG